jgi:tetratricopeptide (TPR) repeat protein
LQKGQEKAAIDYFSKAIEKYNRYAQAFEGRGKAYYMLGRYEDAMIDFNKSASLRPLAEAYFGMGESERAMGDLNKAIQYFQTAIDNAVPYQPIFWMSRRVKGECHAQLNELDKAGFELKLVTKRSYKTTDPNFEYRKQAWQSYGEVLMKAGDTSAAAIAFREALSIESCAIVEELLKSINNEPMYSSNSVGKELVLASN